MASGYTYYGNSGWIKQPNRLVKTFASGLCLIQQDYVRKKDSVDYFSFEQGSSLDFEESLPCIDGAYIFPAPDYQDIGDGFMKCTVTAYGRVNTKGVVSVNLFQGLIRGGITQSQTFQTIEVLLATTPPRTATRVISITDIAIAPFGPGFIEAATIKFVIADGESLTGNISYTPKVFNASGQLVKYPIVKDLGGGVRLDYNYDPSVYDPEATVTTTQTEVDVKGRIEIATVLKNYQSTNFGFFTEITATYSPVFNFLET